MEDVPVGLTQTSLGTEIVSASRTREAHAALIPSLLEEARESLMRMQGMIQETAGHTVVAAAQRMWRAGMTETAQLEFIQSLGQIRAATILKKQVALSRREEALGWTAVGRILALKQFSGHTQERLGSAGRGARGVGAGIKNGGPVGPGSPGSGVFPGRAAPTLL